MENLIMKFYLKIALLIGCTYTAMHSMDLVNDLIVLNQSDRQKEQSNTDEQEQEPSCIGDLLPIEPFSKAQAEAFKYSIASEESGRFKYQVLAGAGMLLASGYALYKLSRGLYDWWKEEDVDEPVLDQLQKRRTESRKLEKRLKKLENAIEVQPKRYNPLGWGFSWGTYLTEKAKSIGSGIGYFAPRIGRHAISLLAASYLYTKASGLANKAQIYLFEGRTISWCIEARTSLKRAVRDLAHWADDLVNMQRPYELHCLSTSASLLVQELEKVVGYMFFVTDQLTVEQEREKTRACVCQTVIEKLANKIVAESNKLMTGEKNLEGDQRLECATMIKTSLSGIINQMEKFEVVQQALGYDNLERLDTFDNLKAELIPEMKKLRAEVREFKVILDNLRLAASQAG